MRYFVEITEEEATQMEADGVVKFAGVSGGGGPIFTGNSPWMLMKSIALRNRTGQE